MTDDCDEEGRAQDEHDDAQRKKQGAESYNTLVLAAERDSIVVYDEAAVQAAETEGMAADDEHDEGEETLRAGYFCQGEVVAQEESGAMDGHEQSHGCRDVAHGKET